jgi:hypothetical protein
MVEDGGRRTALGPYPVCLPLEHADLNLLQSIRTDAIGRFQRHGIEWHHYTDGPGGVRWPSSHLLDSQVQCVNCLLTVARTPQDLLALASTIVPDATDLVAVEDGSPIAFEWIGTKDYLGEGRGNHRYRGRFVTSADALIVVKTRSASTAILIEWKYTESYDHAIPFVSARGTDRREVYRARFNSIGGPFREAPPIDTFFHEPHYQLMRQHLLATAMVEASEFGVDRAVVAFIVPSGNEALRTCIPSGLASLGDTVPKVWGRLLRAGRVAFVDVPSDGLLSASKELRHRYCGGTEPASDSL